MFVSTTQPARSVWREFFRFSKLAIREQFMIEAARFNRSFSHPGMTGLKAHAARTMMDPKWWEDAIGDQKSLDATGLAVAQMDLAAAEVRQLHEWRNGRPVRSTGSVRHQVPGREGRIPLGTSSLVFHSNSRV